MYREKNRPIWQKYILSVVGIVTLLLLWEVLVRINILSVDKVVAPSQIVLTFIEKLSNPVPDGGTIVVHLAVSLRLVLLGFLVSVVIGVILGLLMGFFESCDRFFTPIFEIIRPIPPLAWIPIVIVVLGIGMKAELFIIFVAAFVPCVINSYLGIKGTSKILINVAKTAGASKWQIFTKVGIPSALPMVFTGIKVSFGSAWATLVAAEMVASSKGLGFMSQQGRQASRPDIVLLGMAVIGLVGAVLTGILTIIEKKAIPWRHMDVK